MDIVKKIVGINLMILMSYTIVLNMIMTGPKIGITSTLFYFILIQVIINFSMTGGHNLSDEKKERRKAYLLSSVVVLLVGFSACIGSSSYY